MTTETKDKLGYGSSEQGNFTVIDTIGVPHPYCITPKHVAWAADHHCGMLTKDAIREAEERGGAKCDICRKAGSVLSIDEHEQALLVECKQETKDNKELHAYLLRIKDDAEQGGYAGFAFKKAF